MTNYQFKFQYFKSSVKKKDNVQTPNLCPDTTDDDARTTMYIVKWKVVVVSYNKSIWNWYINSQRETKSVSIDLWGVTWHFPLGWVWKTWIVVIVRLPKWPLLPFHSSEMLPQWMVFCYVQPAMCEKLVKKRFMILLRYRSYSSMYNVHTYSLATFRSVKMW